MPYTVTKKFGHECGYSCCYRQWRAESHCRFLHGYALAFEFQIRADKLDARGWVYDFGAFREIKRFLETNFDHKLIVARDDPDQEKIIALHNAGLADVIVLNATGCEFFALYVHLFANPIIREMTKGDAILISTSVCEHTANRASFYA